MTRDLLWVDSRAGLLAGAVMLTCSAWLSEWFALPRTLLLAMGAANVCYGVYSAWLYQQRTRAPLAIAALVTANSIWAAVCLIALYRYAAVASIFGLAQLAAEALIVGTLAAMEWRARDALRRRT